MKRFGRIFVSVVWLCLIVDTCWGSQAFVTDSFRISIRRGPSIENKILKFIPSGLEVEVLDVEGLDVQDGWSLVRTLEPENKATKGWVLSRYLIIRKPWENQTKALKQKNLKLNNKLAGIEKEWKEKFLRDVGDYNKMKKDYNAIVATVETQKQTIAGLKTSQNIYFLAIGALILLFGLIIGLVTGRKQRRQSSYY